MQRGRIGGPSWSRRKCSGSEGSSGTFRWAKGVKANLQGPCWMLDGSGNDLGSTTGDDLGGPKVAKGGKGEHLGGPKGSSGTSGRFHGVNGDFCWAL